jgi:hypothetical protein
MAGLGTLMAVAIREILSGAVVIAGVNTLTIEGGAGPPSGLPPVERSYVVQLSIRLHVVEPTSRTYVVELVPHTHDVQPVSRTHAVQSTSRTMEVPR